MSNNNEKHTIKDIPLITCSKFWRKTISYARVYFCEWNNFYCYCVNTENNIKRYSERKIRFVQALKKYWIFMYPINRNKYKKVFLVQSAICLFINIFIYWSVVYCCGVRIDFLKLVIFFSVLLFDLLLLLVLDCLWMFFSHWIYMWKPAAN